MRASRCRSFYLIGTAKKSFQILRPMEVILGSLALRLRRNAEALKL
jgi:hypothetical protein